MGSFYSLFNFLVLFFYTFLIFNYNVLFLKIIIFMVYECELSLRKI